MEKKKRIPSLFPRHRKGQGARKSLIFKSTEQNIRIGSKIKSSPLRIGKMDQASPTGRLNLERCPEATTLLRGKFSWTLKELRPFYSNSAFSLRLLFLLPQFEEE
jgi:hypothetical protein